MTRLLAFLGMTAGGWAGWYVGDLAGGLAAALILSIVGTGAGLYLGRRVADEYF